MKAGDGVVVLVTVVSDFRVGGFAATANTTTEIKVKEDLKGYGPLCFAGFGRWTPSASCVCEPTP